MDANAKRYIREFIASMAGLNLAAEKSRTFCSAFRFAGLPVIPSAFAMWAAIRSFRGMDELQRRIQFEERAFALLSSVLPGDLYRT